MASSVIKMYPDTTQLVKHFQIKSHTTAIIDLLPGASILIHLVRKSKNVNVLISADTWQSGYDVLYGSVPSNITISKTASISQISIENNFDIVVAATII